MHYLAFEIITPFGSILSMSRPVMAPSFTAGVAEVALSEG